MRPLPVLAAENQWRIPTGAPMLGGMTDSTLPQSDNSSPERTFGWWDMFVHPDDDPRSDGGSWGSGTRLSGICATSG